MQEPQVTHYAQTNNRLPCNNERAHATDDLDPVPDHVTCQGCVIALVHQAMTAVKT